MCATKAAPFRSVHNSWAIFTQFPSGTWIHNILIAGETLLTIELTLLKPGSHEWHKHKHKINTKTKHHFSSGTCEDKTTRIFLCFAFCSAHGLCLDYDLMVMLMLICLLCCMLICLYAYMLICLYAYLLICLYAYMLICLYAYMLICLYEYMLMLSCQPGLMACSVFKKFQWISK